MNKEQEQLDHLAEIRSMMEKSSRFLSLSGLSGVFAGVFALIGAGSAFVYYRSLVGDLTYQNVDFLEERLLSFLILDACFVLVFAIGFGLFFTSRRAKRNGQSIWDVTSKRMLVNLALPLLAGGVFAIALIYHGYLMLVAPSTLIFYGLALLNASKFTLDDVRYLGISEIILGLVACFMLKNGLLFWSIGFGVLHIVYGVSMYRKYERK